MNHCRGSTPIYKGYNNSLKGVEPSINRYRGSTPIYTGCDDSLKGGDPSINCRKASTRIYKGFGDCLKGADLSMNHRRASTPIYNIHVYLQGLRSFIERIVVGVLLPFTRAATIHRREETLQ